MPTTRHETYASACARAQRNADIFKHTYWAYVSTLNGSVHVSDVKPLKEYKAMVQKFVPRSAKVV